MANFDWSIPPRRKLALIIGNSDYSLDNNKLSHSINNANDLRDLLETINFTVKKARNLDKNQMLRQVNEFSDLIGDGDLVLFYFSGHGCQVNDVNYLLPTNDAHIEAEIDVEDFGVPVERILKGLTDKNPSYVTILILDCYRPYLLRSTATNTTVEGKGLREIEAPAGTFIQFACGANQTVSDVPKTGRNDLFTKHLLQNITQEDVDIVDIFRRIAADVCRESNKKQRPLSMNRLDQHGQVYLNEVIRWTWKSDAVTIAGGYGPGSTLKRLHCPKGLCVYNNQTVLIADSSNHRIMKYNRGATVGQRIAGKNIQGYRSHLLSGPTNVIFDKKSKSYIICDYHNRRVLQWFRRSSTYAKIIVDNVECCGLAMDDEGSLYVSDTERHEVRRYSVGDRYGTVVAGGNGQGSRLQQLNYPTYIFIGRDQAVYVSDSCNDRVMKWNKDAKKGVLVAGGRGKGRDLTQLNYPTGLLVDRMDSVYVADHRNHRVMCWHNDKKSGNIIVGKYGPGNYENQLNGPEGLAFDQYGNLYVADSNNHRIQRFDIRRS